MDKMNTWIEEFNECLQRRCGMDIVDLGIADHELYARWADLTPNDAVYELAVKYDLDIDVF